MTMTMRYSLAIAGCFSSLALSVSPASAAAKPLGTTPATVVDLSTTDNGVGGNYAAPSATFNDNYYFRLTSGNSGQFSLVNLTTSMFGSTYINIANLAGSLYNQTTSAFIGSFPGSQDATVTHSFALTSGVDYRISVSGTATGLFGGAYALNVQPQTVAPLPGPAGWTVALASGGLLAVGVRRRRRRDAKALTQA